MHARRALIIVLGIVVQHAPQFDDDLGAEVVRDTCGEVKKSKKTLDTVGRRVS